jgi:trans-2,3-dihydro-3-hydroxyanthranilate isomerase
VRPQRAAAFTLPHGRVEIRGREPTAVELPFFTLDVFTDRVFGGNPLAVFPDAAHLPAGLMQRLAREMAYSESVFLGPPETPGATVRVRIFTPGKEVPFAGHPTVGTAVFVASGDYDALPRAASSDATASTRTVVLEENVGLVPVEVTFLDGTPVAGRFTTAVLPEIRPSSVPLDLLARLVGLEPDDLRDDDFRPQMVSCGLPFYVVPVRSLDAARRARLDLSLWEEHVAGLWADHVYVVAMEAEGPDVDVHVRMFAPAVGVPEDPATGSAAAALGGYLAAADGRADGALRWVVEQGIEIGRPGRLVVEADRAGGGTSAVRVGGGAVLVSRGTVLLPNEPSGARR